MRVLFKIINDSWHHLFCQILGFIWTLKLKSKLHFTYLYMDAFLPSAQPLLIILNALAIASPRCIFWLLLRMVEVMFYICKYQLVLSCPCREDWLQHVLNDVDLLAHIYTFVSQEQTPVVLNHCLKRVFYYESLKFHQPGEMIESS